MAFGLSWKSRTGGPTSSTSPTCASYSEAGLSQRTGSDGATIQRYVWIISIAGCGFALELIWYAGERQLPNKISEKREKNCTHKASTWYSNRFHTVGTVGQQYNDLVARLLPIYPEGSVVAGDAVR